jgi:hypothetical protein
VGNQVTCKTVLLGLLVLVCFAFFHYESTEKSMVRAILLEQRAEGWCVGLFYQAPEAAADTSEAKAEIFFAASEGDTLEQALENAQNALPQAASYRLCDHVLLSPESTRDALEEYEQLVLRIRCGRTAASVLACDFTCEELSAQSEEYEELPADVLTVSKAQKSVSPALYQLHTQNVLLLSTLTFANGTVTVQNGSRLIDTAHIGEADENLTQMARMISGKESGYTFRIDEQQVKLRRCVVSVTVQKEGSFVVRLDCQSEFGTQPPTEQQQETLAALCTQTVRTLWAQGEDVLSLKAYAALYGNGQTVLDPTQDALPNIEVQVCVLA